MDWYDFAHSERVSLFDKNQMVEELGYTGYVNYYWQMPVKCSDLYGLVYELKRESDLINMIEMNFPENHFL